VSDARPLAKVLIVDADPAKLQALNAALTTAAELSARFINDRVHANIQKDGTFSVIPRMRGGVTTPDELRRIADVAVADDPIVFERVPPDRVRRALRGRRVRAVHRHGKHFWFELDRLGQRGIGEVRSNFLCWPTRPHYCSQQAAHAPKRVDNVCSWSPVFRTRSWHRLIVKQTTRGPAVWELKAGRVHLVDTSGEVSRPTDREYWLLVLRNPQSGEYKYFVTNAAGGATGGARSASA